MPLPLWKLKREWTRLCQQMQSIPERWTEPRIQKAHDAAFEAGFPQHCGDQQVQPKIALLLIFQPDAVAESFLHTCRYVISQGYAPLIVANGGLSDSGREALRPLAWQILERPNIGYDFGGYRDGIKTLWNMGITPERLFILNDSVWCPLRENSSFLPDLEALDGDICGTILRERSADVRFLESYCYLINPKVWHAEAFKNFWTDLQLTANKYKVIRRGERGFSKAMIEAGYALKPLFNEAIFLTVLRKQDAAFLKATLEYGRHHDPHLEKKRKTILSIYGTKNWNDRAWSYIKDTLRKSQFYSAFPYAVAVLLHYPVLKKSNDLTAIAWRRTYLMAIQKGVLKPPHDSIMSELENSD